MSALKPIFRELRQAVLDGFAHSRDKLHQLTDNLTDHFDNVVHQVRGIDKFDPPGGNGGGGGNGPSYSHGVRFFGEDQLKYYTADNATLGRPGSAVFMMPSEDAVNVSSPIDAAIESGMAPNVTEAAMKGQPVFGAMIPVDHLPQRLPTSEDAGGFLHYLPGGHTAVNINGVHYPNATREFVVDGGTPLPPGTVVFQLGEGGVWDILGIYG
ncbi:hypothetical protein [Microbacterium esteraromaticum]|uniref:hypothetical protein n=1 Tax=Microbacterium esteraromaticum TaxID=57043 RepID=UPI00195ACC26|nr:hypothetical protein [Microbacterium esteraromaticum]MBM7465635.1 hypothetical protein [Microbacterium esteraromaticum]